MIVLGVRGYSLQRGVTRDPKKTNEGEPVSPADPEKQTSPSAAVVDDSNQISASPTIEAHDTPVTKEKEVV